MNGLPRRLHGLPGAKSLLQDQGQGQGIAHREINSRKDQENEPDTDQQGLQNKSNGYGKPFRESGKDHLPADPLLQGSSDPDEHKATGKNCRKPGGDQLCSSIYAHCSVRISNQVPALQGISRTKSDPEENEIHDNDTTPDSTFCPFGLLPRLFQDFSDGKIRVTSLLVLFHAHVSIVSGHKLGSGSCWFLINIFWRNFYHLGLTEPAVELGINLLQKIRVKTLSTDRTDVLGILFAGKIILFAQQDIVRICLIFQCLCSMGKVSL